MRHALPDIVIHLHTDYATSTPRFVHMILLPVKPSVAMPQRDMDLTDSDDDLDVISAVKKDLGHEDHINSVLNTFKYVYPYSPHLPILQRSSTIMNPSVIQLMIQTAIPPLSEKSVRSDREVRE